MPSLTNSTPLTPAAPNDMSIAECYSRIDEFINKYPTIKTFKIEDDNHGMGMLSTMTTSPKQAINVRLDQSTIRNYLVNNGFSFTNDSICSRT